MHIPTLLPDEHSKGYQGRIRRLNGDIPLVTLRKHLVNSLNTRVEDLEKYNIVEALALASQVGLERFVRNHTLMPFLRIVHSDSAASTHGTASSYRQLTQAGLVVSDRRAKFCLDCINEDRLSTGVAYWRRSHQLPGIVFCSKHESILFEVDGDAPALGLPIEFQKIAEPIAEDVALAVKQNAVIQRYVHICNAFLKSEAPIHRVSAAMRITKQVGKCAPLLQQAEDRGGSLNELAVSMLGGPWLTKFFPSVIDHKGKQSTRIDSVTKKLSGGHAVWYALALSMCWNSPEAAYAEFSRPSDVAERAAIISCGLSSGQKYASLGRSKKSGDINIFGNVKRALNCIAAGSSIVEAGARFKICTIILEKILNETDPSDASITKKFISAQFAEQVCQVL